MARLLSRSKMYGTPATLKMYIAVHFVRESECIVYTLLKKFAFFSEYAENYFQFQKITLITHVENFSKKSY